MSYEQQNENEMLYFRMNLLQAEIKMQGMIAENKQREIQGESLAYTNKSFVDLIEEHRIHHNKFPTLKY
jgi:hypothetical protein